MRAFAITGIETAEMIPSIMSGSLMRDTPPCARMSAGTRSSAITATAPASSAILACSGVTTSMITPPLSISAMPRLTRAVPTLGCPLEPFSDGAVGVWASDTVGPRSTWWLGRGTAPVPPSTRVPLPHTRRRDGSSLRPDACPGRPAPARRPPAGTARLLQPALSGHRERVAVLLDLVEQLVLALRGTQLGTPGQLPLPQVRQRRRVALVLALRRLGPLAVAGGPRARLAAQPHRGEHLHLVRCEPARLRVLAEPRPDHLGLLPAQPHHQHDHRDEQRHLHDDVH